MEVVCHFPSEEPSQRHNETGHYRGENRSVEGALPSVPVERLLAEELVVSILWGRFEYIVWHVTLKRAFLLAWLESKFDCWLPKCLLICVSP